jgi:succinate dehydrogenase hydrophobic anchor subunit
MHHCCDPARPKTPEPTVSTSTRNPARRRRLATVICSTASAAVLAVSPALAATSGQYQAVAADIPTVISNVTNWLITILAVLATLMLTIGGVRYVLAAGDPAEVEKAKTCFKSAAMGYCLAVLAPVVVAVLKTLVGGP